MPFTMLCGKQSKCNIYFPAIYVMLIMKKSCCHDTKSLLHIGSTHHAMTLFHLSGIMFCRYDRSQAKEGHRDYRLRRAGAAARFRDPAPFLVGRSLHINNFRPVKERSKRPGSTEYRSMSRMSPPFSTPSPFQTALLL